MAKKEYKYAILYDINADDEFYRYTPVDAIKGEIIKEVRNVFINGEWVDKEVDVFVAYDKDLHIYERYVTMEHSAEQDMCVGNIITVEELIEKYPDVKIRLGLQEELLHAFFEDYRDCTICKQRDYFDDEDDYEESTFKSDWLLQDPEKISLIRLQTAWDCSFDTISACEDTEKISEVYDYLVDILDRT